MSRPKKPAPRDIIQFEQKIRLGKKASTVLVEKPRALFRPTDLTTNAPCTDWAYLTVFFGNIVVFRDVEAFGSGPIFPAAVLGRTLSPLDPVRIDVRYTGKNYPPPPPAERMLIIKLGGELVPASVTQQRRWQKQA